MINWLSTTTGRNTTEYIAAVIGSNKGKTRDTDYRQIALRFSYQAQQDLRLILGDRISIGFDDTTKQICFKRTTLGGYKLTFSTKLKDGELTPANKILVVAASTFRPTVASVQYSKEDIVIEPTHISINAPEFFKV